MYDYDITGKRILEIGCGMALVSHLLNHREADVTAMDIHPLSEEFLAHNVLLNHGRPIPFVNASWSDDSPELGQFDLIVGSDILYEPRHVKTLAPFLDLHTRQNCEVIIVDPNRGQLADFHAAMGTFGFSREDLTPGLLNRLATPYQGVVFRYSR